MLVEMLRDKVCLVTGAASGIGRATVELLAERAATPIVADIDISAASEVAEGIRQRDLQAEAFELDVSHEAAWQSAMKFVLARFGRLDVLVNNAGIASAAPMADCSFDVWRSVMAVNLDGVFLGTRSAIETMVDGGSIINVSSVAGIKPTNSCGAYGASKAAMRMLSKIAAMECADNGSCVRVNLVTPGGVRTPIWEKQPFFRQMIDDCGSVEEAFRKMEGSKLSESFSSSRDVAESIVYLASDASSHLNGVELQMCHGQFN